MMKIFFKLGALCLTLLGLLLITTKVGADMSGPCEMDQLIQLAQASTETSGGMKEHQHSMSASEPAAAKPSEASPSASQSGMAQMMGKGMMGGKMMGGQQTSGGMGGMSGMGGKMGGGMGHMMGGGKEMGMGKMMGMMGSHSPKDMSSMASGHHEDFFLNSKKELELTPEQVTALKGLALAYKKDMIRQTADKELAKLDLDELLEKKDVDLAKVKAKVAEMAKIKGDLMFSLIEKRVKAKALLTEDQLKKLTSLAASMEGGMKCCEMMGGEHAGGGMKGETKDASQAGSEKKDDSTEHKGHTGH